MKTISLSALLATAFLAVPSAPTAAAQANVIPGTDVALGILEDLTQVGRQGPFPNGTNAISMATTSCNFGTVDVPWLSPMQEDHPLIAFLLVRVDDSGRMFQISDYSYVKHGFFALASSQCNSCSLSPFGHDGTFLGVNCSDTYGVGNNSDNFWLAPAEEIDPWFGDWEATCSFFDMGLNPTPGTMCDGNRSFSGSQSGSLGPIGNRVVVPDAAFSTVGNPQYAYSSYYVVRGEPEANRNNNLGYKGFSPIWNGSSWNFADTSPLIYGSVLDQWAGARVESDVNGGDDGRVYVASKVDGPDENGLYHYEYVVHNRDNFRGVGELRIPLCEAAGATNFGFRDVDLDNANNWTFNVVGDELVISTGNNPVRWNSMYNFWFDSTAAPADGEVDLGQFFSGAGADSFAVAADVPGTAYAVDLGPGCSSGTAPELAIDGIPSLGNAAFAFDSTDQASGATTALFFSLTPTALPIGSGCTVYVGGALGAGLFEGGVVTADASGDATFAFPVPANPALEGVDAAFQVLEFGVGPAFGLGDLSNGLLVRFGNDVAGCGE
ncbi:MAG: hypothetical protein AAFZ65_07435 [Planctomycetota bacterium]